MAHKTAIMAARGRETPSAPSGLVPLRGGTVLSLYIIRSPSLLVSGFAKIRVFFEKKVPQSLPDNKKRRTFAPAIRKTTGCGKKKRSLKGLHKTRQHKEA